MKETTLETSHGRIAVRETEGGGTPILLIHGNSSSGAIFANQMAGPLGRRHRILAPDLPGHGASGDALDPVRSYSMPGYADAMTEVLKLSGIDRAIVFGWSLGGHIGLEMISRYPGLLALMITGTPPVSAAEVSLGFRPSPHMNLAGKEHFTAEDVEAYARSTCGEPFEPVLRDIVARTDGRARRLMFESFAAGRGDDQSAIVATSKVPLAVVNGADEPFVNTDFVAKVRYANLWEGRCHLIENSGHAPFWDKPAEFDAIFERFVGDFAEA
ncbi:alpha/beta fold hydrolase [Labrys wisconsinensis]|uniref:Pimeloyl-ACP methyl ester carboxylesterase n=1 Tax=Labrys wisconsinensis TaxID=425677 RepID=A0ABU0JG93_9HYPH|nr:alpha/beta hydrolase [Labrys wisconsinensis]MDQ0473299.1 pimeloyl-ACP methyl ester carboxylesterase [Labrys wisconsinensis]